jgi:hypothetical protein
VAKRKKADLGQQIQMMTTEHFTLQSARGILNSEIVARVSLYFTTLSGVVVALAFLAQRMSEVLYLFGLLAVLALLLIGFTSLVRIVQLASVDVAYIRAINRIRRFYADHSAAWEKYSLFPAHDDGESVAKYGGYGLIGIQNVLAMGFLVMVVNSLVAAGLIAAVAYGYAKWPLNAVIVVAIVSVGLFAAFQITVARVLAKKVVFSEYAEVRFPQKEKKT